MYVLVTFVCTRRSLFESFSPFFFLHFLFLFAEITAKRNLAAGKQNHHSFHLDIYWCTWGLLCNDEDFGVGYAEIGGWCYCSCADRLKRLLTEKEAAAGFLRIGSLNVRVKKTTEAFNNLLSSAGGSGTFSNTKTYNKPWGSIDNLAISTVVHFIYSINSNIMNCTYFRIFRSKDKCLRPTNKVRLKRSDQRIGPNRSLVRLPCYITPIHSTDGRSSRCWLKTKKNTKTIQILPMVLGTIGRVNDPHFCFIALFYL